MQVLIEAVLPSLENAMDSVGIKGDFWRNMLGRSKEANQGDLALPCFPFAKQLGCSPDDAAKQIADALNLGAGVRTSRSSVPQVRDRPFLVLANKCDREDELACLCL